MKHRQVLGLGVSFAVAQGWIDMPAEPIDGMSKEGMGMTGFLGVLLLYIKSRGEAKSGSKGE